MMNPGRPVSGEVSPFYDTYIGRVPEGDLIAILDRQIGETEALLGTYTEVKAQWRPAPGEWNATEIVGHLADMERVFTFRALSFARGDTAPLPSVDQPVFMQNAGFASRPLADVVSEFVAVRRATVALFGSLDAAAWARGGVANGTPISVRALAFIIAGHELHHRVDLEQYPALADAVGQA